MTFLDFYKIEHSQRIPVLDHELTVKLQGNLLCVSYDNGYHSCPSIDQVTV